MSDGYIELGCEPFIPSVYDNEYSLYEVICKQGEKIEKIEDDIEKKQDKLKSGENVKTINGESILGEGDINIPGTEGNVVTQVNGKTGSVILTGEDIKTSEDSEESISESIERIERDLENKIDVGNSYTKEEVNALVNQKIDSADVYDKSEMNDLLNEKANALDVYDKIEVDRKLNEKANVSALDTKQNVLVSGVNVKTINGETILGSGNIVIQGAGGAVTSVNGETGDVVLTTSNIVNDSGYITSADIANKANDNDVYHEWKLEYNGTNFVKGGVVQSFNDIYTAILDKTKFVYALFQSRLYIPQYVTSALVSFSCSYLDNNTPTIRRIRMSSTGDITTTTEIMYNKDEVDGFISQSVAELSTKLSKSPLAWDVWTEAEQAAAQERIGILSVEGVLF